MKKKILLSLATIGGVAALTFAVTGAFFSDTETSTGNTFAAGAIDLKIDNTSYGFDWNNPAVTAPTGVWGLNNANSWQSTDLTTQKFFSFDDLKPGDYGEDTISLLVNSNDAYACMAFDLTATPENTWTSPEQEFGDPGTLNGNDGELQKYLSFLFWYDDGDNVLEVGEQVIPELSGLPGSIFTGGWLPIAEGGDTPLPANTTRYIGKGWCFGAMTQTPVAQDRLTTNPPSAPGRIGFTCDGTGDQNDAQTDGIVVDVAFHAVQSRNNAGFLCSSLPRPDGRQVVGAALGEYVQPTGGDCDVNVDSALSETTTTSATINGGIAAADPGETVCVDDGTYVEDVNVNKSITLSGDGATATSTINGVGTGEAGALVITANNVVVEGFNVIGTGVSAIRISGARDNVTIRNNKAVAASGQNALLMDGGQSNHTVWNNIFEGASSQLVYVNGLASVNNASTNVDFLNNTFRGTGNMALGQEAGASDVKWNKFSTVTSFTDVEDWEGGNLYNQNNFNDAGLNLQHSENGFTGDNGITNAENNWWGDGDPSDGDVNLNVDVDFTPFEVSAFPEN